MGIEQDLTWGQSQKLHIENVGCMGIACLWLCLGGGKWGEPVYTSSHCNCCFFFPLFIFFSFGVWEHVLGNVGLCSEGRWDFTYIAWVFCCCITLQITLKSFPLFSSWFARSWWSRNMKKHRRNLLLKRSQLLALSGRWTAGFGELRKCCFQKQFFLAKRKRQSAQLIVSLNHNKLFRSLQCRRRALELQSRWAPDVQLNAETYQKPTVEP